MARIDRRHLRFDVHDDVAFEVLARGRLPLGLGTPQPSREVFRDVYYDTPDGLLEERGVISRIRQRADGQQLLTVRSDGRYATAIEREDLDVTGLDLSQVWRGTSAAATVLRALTDPVRLAPILEIQMERYVRLAHWLGWPKPSYRLAVSRARARSGDQFVDFLLAKLTSLSRAGPTPTQLSSRLLKQDLVHPSLVDALQRARMAFDAVDAVSLTTALQTSRECALFPVRDGDVGFRRHDGQLSVFWRQGSGEAMCRAVLDQSFGSSQGQVRRLGQAAARPWRAPLEVWMARHLPEHVAADPAIEWISLPRAIKLAGTPLLRDTRTLSALQVAAQSDLMPERRPTRVVPAARPLDRPRGARDHTDTGRYLDADISQLDFNARVLDLAEDTTLSLPDRIGYLAIAASNLDEFFMVRVAALKRAAHARPGTADGRQQTPLARLDAVRLRARSLQEHMHASLTDRLIPAMAGVGIRIRSWPELDTGQQAALTRRFFEEIRPRLVPLAATANHPFPHIDNSVLALAVRLKDPAIEGTHFATVSLPSSLPRFVPLDAPGEWFPIEALVCAHSRALFDGLAVLSTHFFRITRSGETVYGESDSTDVLQLVADTIDQRAYQPVVRLEVERSMPEEVRALLMQEFRFELPDRVSNLEPADVIEVEGLMALRGLREIASGLLSRVPLQARSVFPAGESVFDTVRARDVLVHFPYDSFQGSVLRFLDASAADPAVESITVTLYRTSDSSPVVEALHRARAAGKTVVVLVELKARFDETRNIDTAKALRANGVHIVYGVAEMKLHSKILLVLRRDSDGLRRYAFIGSGNFHPITASLYTDVGLFTSRQAVTDELAGLVDSLTSLSVRPAFTELLVSPTGMVARLLALIQREAEHAQHGRPARIRVKLNGLDDQELVDALYDASSAGVEVDLSIRGICTIRPGIPGLSDRIRVISVLGEFLEHARVVHVANGGTPEYYIGSADWRERNLRRRVEVMTPVTDPASQARLHHLLDLEFEDPGSWHLDGDGQWTRHGNAQDPSGTQKRLLAELAAPVLLRRQSESEA